MSEPKDEKWLKEQLQRAINGSTPVFDVKAWKQKYATEYETLLGRGKQKVERGLPHHVISILRGPFAKVAVTAAILLAAGILIVGRFGSTPVPPTPGSLPVTQQSPAQMISMISLSAAFRRGGIEELDKQCDRSLKQLGPRPTSVTVQELLKDISKG